ncbi:MAG: 2-hydroxyacid dehydrogenase [Proteobacteria bacterium]|nr:2-hydroxyacid dehydrogenase [Pseudomonadota bacterium]
MANEKRDVLLIGARKPVLVGTLEGKVNLHSYLEAKDKDAFVKEVGSKIGAIALVHSALKIDGPFLSQFPNLKQISSFGVGYDQIDAKWAGEHGIIVTNTPDVLNEEVADTALGLLLCTLREFPQADRYVRAGKWPKAPYPLTKATLQGRIVGMVGMGRIGRAIAKRLEAFNAKVVYHSRNPQSGVGYKHYPKLLDMARDVDTLMIIVPGGASTKNMINAEVLKALGSQGVVINMARGSVIDEPALIEALKNKTIYSAGLDVFANEPEVPQELLDMDHVVLFPHVGSASEATRAAMDRLVADNILAWADGKPPLTPVPETPYPPRK